MKYLLFWPLANLVFTTPCEPGIMIPVLVMRKLMEWEFPCLRLHKSRNWGTTQVSISWKLFGLWTWTWLTGTFLSSSRRHCTLNSRTHFLPLIKQSLREHMILDAPAPILLWMICIFGASLPPQTSTFTWLESQDYLETCHTQVFTVQCFIVPMVPLQKSFLWW